MPRGPLTGWPRGVSQVDLVEEIGVFSQVVSPCIFNRDVSVQS